jgi:NADPH2:quinone reductase
MAMQAIRIHQFGAPDVMHMEELSVPAPPPGFAVVRITAASVNFIDVQRRRGDLVGQPFYEEHGLNQLPSTMGSQGVGVVESVGEGVTNVHLGDRVTCIGNTYAMYALSPAQALFPIVEGVSFEQAAAGQGQGWLAYAFTHHAYPVQAGDWCLVQAAAGGLGLLIVQMAKLRGGRVIGVTSREDKGQALREAGADEIIISAQSDIATEARRITGGEGVRVVYDGVGKDTFVGNLDSLGRGGYLIIYGQSGGYIPPFDIMTLQEKGSLFITRNNSFPYVAHMPEYFANFAAWVQEGKIRITFQTYPLADAVRVHAAFEARDIVGRALLIP